MKRLLLLLVFAAVLAGCGANPDGAPVIDNVGNNYKLILLPYEGSNVRCWKMTRGGGHVSGLSCDFDAFHHHHGYHPDYYDVSSGQVGG